MAKHSAGAVVAFSEIEQQEIWAAIDHDIESQMEPATGDTVDLPLAELYNNVQRKVGEALDDMKKSLKYDRVNLDLYLRLNDALLALQHWSDDIIVQKEKEENPLATIEKDTAGFEVLAERLRVHFTDMLRIVLLLQEHAVKSSSETEIKTDNQVMDDLEQLINHLKSFVNPLQTFLEAKLNVNRVAVVRRAAAEAWARLLKIRLCARLADYAYVSGNPGIADNEWLERCLGDYRIRNLESFFTHSWLQKSESQHRFFKSHAYVCQLEKKDGSDNVNRIVVGFRGTWLHKSTPADRANENTPGSVARSGVLSKLSNLSLDVFGPSNYGLADLYYDATLIRVPYRTGVVWKWYTYWGSLVLEGSNWARRCFAWPRRVAAGLIYRPDGYYDAKLRNPLVHLGFWALWASAEGFAGYDRQGHLWTDQTVNDSQESHTPGESVRPGVLPSILHAVQESVKSRETEILVVGHSLGGAVSCFAALDIVRKLETDFPNVKVFHATFGAPPVGTKRFAEFFRSKMQGHESWAVFHERDIIAKCFAWCGLIPVIKWLGWWSDWSRAGDEKIIRKTGCQASPASQRENGFSWRALLRAFLTPDGLKCGLIFVGTLLFLGFSSLTTPLSMLITPVCWLVDWKYYSKQKNPPSNWEDTKSEDRGDVQGLSEDRNLNHAALEYHSLEKYIELLEDNDPFGVPGNESNRPSAVERE